MYAFHDHRNMIFVDGENFTIRGQEYARKKRIQLQPGGYWSEDVFLWMPGCEADLAHYTRAGFTWGGTPLRRAERAYFYTSVSPGNARVVKKTNLALRSLHFEPRVFT